MPSSISLVTIGALLLTLVSPPAVLALQKNQLAFDFTRTVGFGRIDPIRTPGTVSEHVHRFLGASYLPPAATYDDLQKSNCSTHPVQVDKSSYWMSAMYHIGPDGKYTLIEGGNNIVYYGTNGDPTAFPDDFKMLTGSPTQSCDEGPNRYFYCVVDGKGTHTQTLPEGRCDTLGQHIIFPSCWDGKKFTPDNQDDHLVFPDDGSLGNKCPATHKTKLPYVMMDMFADTSDLPANPHGPTWSLSTGDTKGCGMHGDFINGWKRDVLQSALDQCVDFTGDMKVETCPPLTKHIDRNAEAQCQWQGPLPDEDIGIGGSKLDALPTCGNGVEHDLSTCPKGGPKFVDSFLVNVLDAVPLPVPVALKSKFKASQILGAADLISSSVSNSSMSANPYGGSSYGGTVTKPASAAAPASSKSASKPAKGSKGSTKGSSKGSSKGSKSTKPRTQKGSKNHPSSSHQVVHHPVSHQKGHNASSTKAQPKPQHIAKTCKRKVVHKRSL